MLPCGDRYVIIVNVELEHAAGLQPRSIVSPVPNAVLIDMFCDVAEVCQVMRLLIKITESFN